MENFAFLPKHRRVSRGVEKQLKVRTLTMAKGWQKAGEIRTGDLKVGMATFKVGNES